MFGCTLDIRDRSYRRATKDYSSRLGNRELYRPYFREAYQIGYNDGLNPGRNDNSSYRDWNRDRNRNEDNNDQNRRGRNWDRYDNYGGSFQLRQTALNAGYNEGIKEGRNDRNNNSGKASLDLEP